MKQEFNFLTAEIAALTNRKDSGLFTEDMRTDLKKKRSLLKEVELKITKTKRDMIRKRKSRMIFKSKLKQIFKTNPDMKKELKVIFTHTLDISKILAD